MKGLVFDTFEEADQRSYEEAQSRGYTGEENRWWAVFETSDGNWACYVPADERTGEEKEFEKKWIWNYEN